MSDGERQDPAHGDERFSPGAGGPLIAYEHLHRYALAARLAAGRRVLDLACGTGYGSRMLATAGAWVVALDLASVGLREVKCGVRGNATALPFAASSFDLVVCFEAIEHLASPAGVADEICRVLSPDGVALLSTPDRSLFAERAGLSNPHHVSEMTRREFEDLLRARFGGVVCYGQSVWAGSWISRLPPARRARGATRRLHTLTQEVPAGGEGMQRAPWAADSSKEPPDPLYLIALCSREPGTATALAQSLGTDSVLHDPRQWLLGRFFEATRAVVDRDHEIESQQRHARNLETELKELRQLPTGDAGHLARLHAAYEFERQERSSIAKHAENLELLLSGAWKHGGNLAVLLRASERELRSVAAHARNLEIEVAELRKLRAGDRAHARNLERELGDLRQLRSGDREHARNLDRELVPAIERIRGLEAHAANLERDLRRVSEHREALLEHSANLVPLFEQRRKRIEGLEAHIANIEAELERLSRHRSGLLSHTENLERVLARERELRAGTQQHADNLELLLAARENELQGLASAHDLLMEERERLTHQLEAQRREGDLHRLRLETQLARSALDLERVEEEVERLRSSIWFRVLRRTRLAR